MEGTAFFSLLLPDTTSLRLDAWCLDTAASLLTVSVTSTQTIVSCPVCAVPAARIHSRYTRTLADLPWAAYRVRLQLRVRKWCCANLACGRRIFTERLPTVAAPWARRTRRLVQRLVALGLALGGRAGVLLSHAWDVVVSRHTLLRVLRQFPGPEAPTPTVLGVDDFALRTRQTYGTVLIDLERRQPIALLPERNAETVAQWLQGHPGVQVIARDRWCAYAEGARQGAPTATQVADRFHLLQNLREALEQVFVTQRHSLAAVNATQRQQPVWLPDGALAVPVPPHDLPRPEPQRAAQHQARRQALHQQIRALHHQGWTARAIAQHLGLDRRTVQHDLRSATFAGRLRRSDLGTRVLHPYKP
jgi:transposase